MPDEIRYERSLGQFRGQNGRIVGRAKVLSLVDEEAARLSVRAQALARLLTAGKIAISDFQERLAVALKLSHLRMTTLAAGGREGLTQRHYGRVGYELRTQYEFLHGFGQDLEAGKYDKAEDIVRRAGMYGASSRTAFFESEKLTKEMEYFNEAKRDLDPQSKHCPSCLRYSTNGLWRPITQVIAPGVQCECRSKCKCRILYRKRK
jgi:hypothetical protein